MNYQPAAGGGYIGSFIGTSRIIDSDEAEEITRNVWIPGYNSDFSEFLKTGIFQTGQGEISKKRKKD